MSVATTGEVRWRAAMVVGSGRAGRAGPPGCSPRRRAGAAAEAGIVLDRLALVPQPGPEWPTVVAALIDGVDVVVTAVPSTVPASIADRLAARARQRGSVLVPYGRWDGADVTLQVVRGIWQGLGPGRGRLRRREVTISARGRGAAARPREVKVWLPGDELTRVIPGPATVARPGATRLRVVAGRG